MVNDSGFISATDLPSDLEGAVASNMSPKMDGEADVGTELTFARGDHVHPTDITRVPVDRTINGKSLAQDIVLTAEDVNAEPVGSSLAVLQMVYPIGSIYMSANSVNPANLFGFGEWGPIQDCFILAAGTAYSAGETGGEAEHTLTIDEMPSHAHLLSQDVITDNTSGEFLVGSASKWDHTFNVLIGSTELEGGSAAHNNMPPYLAVYVWKRVA